MSTYNWESGTITLPSAGFARFRRNFIDGYNKIQQTKLDNVKNWREKALRQGKGKYNYDFHDYMNTFCSNDAEYMDVEKVFTNPDGTDGRKRPLMPTKKMFNFVNGNDNHFDCGDGDASVSFNQNDRTVSWHVSENNHAVEHARESKEGNLLFTLLRNVQWTNKSGGTIVGNDEYNRDNEYEGGGGNYVTATYGKQ